MVSIFTRDTISMWIEHHKDGMHVVSEIDDDEKGFKSEIHYIISHDEVKKLYSIVSENEFIELCRKGGTFGLANFLTAHNVLFLRVPVR